MVPGPAPARAVLRVRPDRGRGPRRVPGRVLAAGVVGRGAVLPAPHDARPARRRERARRLELIRPTLPDWLTKLTITGLPVGDDSVDLLVHRWRGRTSAELLGRRGSIDVIIHA